MGTSSGKPPIRMAQYGTKHAHAPGVLSVMLADAEVELTGVFEPDPERLRQLQQAGEKPWSDVNWYDDPSEFLDDPTITAVASEGGNAESLDHTDAIIDAGKHAFYDKPAGDDYARFESIVARARGEVAAGPDGATCFDITTASNASSTGRTPVCWDMCFRSGRTSLPASRASTGRRSPSLRAVFISTLPAT